MNSTNELKSKVEIGVACRHLKSMDVASKSDPMAVLYVKSGNVFQEIGRTETIKNNHNPVFAKKFLIDYFFELRQILKVEIYDSDSKSVQLSNHDFLGSFEFSLGQLVSRRTFESQLTQHGVVDKMQAVILSCTEMVDSKEVIKLQLSGSKLDKKDTFGKSDPFLEFYRCQSSVSFTPDFKSAQSNNLSFSLVHRTAPQKNTLNPSWPPIELALSQLCLGDHNRLIKVICLDWDSDGSSDLIGEFFTSISDLQTNIAKTNHYKIINTKKASKKKNYDNSGTITVHKAAINIEYSFFDYISTGTELNFSVAIDFTGSNGDPKSTRSLHYIPPITIMGSCNQYEMALSAIGSIIEDYDSDKMFPGLGFGAKIPPNHSAVSHCFPLTFQNNNPYCAGVSGLIQAYRMAITNVQLFGPTYFTPCIRHVANFANSFRDGSKYFVLLILTDGIITDLDETIEAIIDCSNLPMSIIIIGVGSEDFSAMDILDCDKGNLRIRNKISIRDIVQFVPIRDFLNSSRDELNHEGLTRAVLRELPTQVTKWMKINQLKPLNKMPSAKPPISQVGDSSTVPPYPVN